MQLKCTVSELNPLRIPSTYRAKLLCEKLSIEIELHSEILEMTPGDKYLIEFIEPENKNYCLEKYDVCGNSYVVSFTKIENKYRLILSIGGLLLKIVGAKEHIPLRTEPNTRYIVGIKRI